MDIEKTKGDFMLMKIRGLKRNFILMTITASFMVPNFSFAATSDNDLESLIQNQQQLLQQLNDKKVKAQDDALSNRISSIEAQISDLKNQKSYDAQGAINSLSDQMNVFKDQVSAQVDAQSKIMDELKKIENQQKEKIQDLSDDGGYHGNAASTKYLVNPGPAATISYTQDAINSQGNSTMIFAYAPNQLYKIYCRTGYLTDIELKKGEKVTFVGGGDTNAWTVKDTEIDGTPHIYIKPIVQTSTTNIIINTTKHSYQIILNTSDWYNPMIQWSYDKEDHIENLIQQKKDEKTITGTLNVSNPEQLNFDYEISGDSNNKPTMVFDDGSKTYIKFKNMTRKMPALFVKEKGKKEVSLVNYKVKDNYYIVDTVFAEAQLRVSDKEIITIKQK